MKADAIRAVKEADKVDVGRRGVYINANNGFMRSSKNARRHYKARSRVWGLDGAYKGYAILVSV